MKYLTSKETAENWGLSERSVRNYCANKRISGAFLQGKTWMIPETAAKPERKNKAVSEPTLLDVLMREREAKTSGGIYHKLQIEMTYNSNYIEGSKLTHDETRYIFETKTIGRGKAAKVDDIIETVNHFRCMDYIIKTANYKLSESYVKELHRILKSGTSDADKDWFNVGEYKALPNEVGGNATTSPKKVHGEIAKLISKYNTAKKIDFEKIVKFHQEFERIHPFQDGNGRVGRLIMFKECLKNNIVPVIITDDIKFYYYRGLTEWKNDKTYLIETCRAGQDVVKKYLDYFRIRYVDD